MKSKEDRSTVSEKVKDFIEILKIKEVRPLALLMGLTGMIIKY